MSGGYGDFAYVFCNTLVSRQCRGGVSSVLAFSREALPFLRYFPKDTELALGMTLLELHCILQVFTVSIKRMGER